VRAAFDTSVLVAALVEPHPLHRRAICWLAAAVEGRLTAECSWHAVAETWSVLTRLPMDPPVSPWMAEAAIDRMIVHVRPTELSRDTYAAAIRRCSERGLRSGSVFDALHLVCAEAVGVDAFVTFNPEDFDRLALSAGPPIVVPPDPPEVRLGGRP
jgi:predicted nucleic acid-binding protein